MRRASLLVFSFYLLVLPLAGMGQNPAAAGQNEAEMLSARFVSDYDSLLNSYLFRRYADLSRRQKAAIVDFDGVGDSVIALRLRAMHTVIPMNYNEVVRSHIRMYLSRMANRMDVMLTLAEFYAPVFEESLARWNVPEEINTFDVELSQSITPRWNSASDVPLMAKSLRASETVFTVFS